jgi:hypothetical protein
MKSFKSNKFFPLPPPHGNLQMVLLDEKEIFIQGYVLG